MKYVKSVHIRSYSGLYPVQMRENRDQNNSKYGHFSRRCSDSTFGLLKWTCFACFFREYVFIYLYLYLYVFVCICIYLFVYLFIYIFTHSFFTFSYFRQIRTKDIQILDHYQTFLPLQKILGHYRTYLHVKTKFVKQVQLNAWKHLLV